jgi:DNA invertase Pin-like site-specific DNA recombinase
MTNKIIIGERFTRNVEFGYSSKETNQYQAAYVCVNSSVNQEEFNELSKTYKMKGYKVFIDFESGLSHPLTRPEFSLLIKDAEQGLVQSITIDCLSQISRNTKDLYEVIELLNRYKVLNILN